MNNHEILCCLHCPSPEYSIPGRGFDLICLNSYMVIIRVGDIIHGLALVFFSADTFIVEGNQLNANIVGNGDSDLMICSFLYGINVFFL